MERALGGSPRPQSLALSTDPALPRLDEGRPQGVPAAPARYVQRNSRWPVYELIEEGSAFVVLVIVESLRDWVIGERLTVPIREFRENYRELRGGR